MNKGFVPDVAEFLSAIRVTVKGYERESRAIQWCYSELGDPICTSDLVGGEGRDGETIWLDVTYQNPGDGGCRFDHNKKWMYIDDIWEGSHFFFKSLTDAVEFKLRFG